MNKIEDSTNDQRPCTTFFVCPATVSPRLSRKDFDSTRFMKASLFFFIHLACLDHLLPKALRPLSSGMDARGLCTTTSRRSARALVDPKRTRDQGGESTGMSGASADVIRTAVGKGVEAEIVTGTRIARGAKRRNAANVIESESHFKGNLSRLTGRSRSNSPSDRRKRKEAKALVKENTRRVTEMEQSRAVAELSMYTGADNPFHDANIGQQFVWNKKREKEKKAGLTAEQIARKDHLRRLEAEEELAKLNKRRADREMEMQMRDEEEGKMRRLAEEATMKEWTAREDDFQLEQSRRRAGIRLREQRGKAIDFLAINLRFADPGGMARHTAAIGSLANPRKTEVEREEEEEGWGWADAGFEFEIDEPWRIFDVSLPPSFCERY